MGPLELVNLTRLMERTSGKPEVKVGLIDGPVATNHPDLGESIMKDVSGNTAVVCSTLSSKACMHGTFVAGMLVARRGSDAPALCPKCTLLVRPIFAEESSDSREMPSAAPDELAAAIVETTDAGARVINLSVALVQPSISGDRTLEEALDYALDRRVMVVVAAGNQAAVGSTTLTRHPWVIPVVACDDRGRLLTESNLGSSIGRRGLCAPGKNIKSLSTDKELKAFSGTSAAAPFVTGALALLFSEFPDATASQVKFAITKRGRRQTSVTPPLLDAWVAYDLMKSSQG